MAPHDPSHSHSHSHSHSDAPAPGHGHDHAHGHHGHAHDPDDPHALHRAPVDELLEEAISTVLATVDIESVLERAGTLMRHHFGATRIALHRLTDREGWAEVLLVDDPKLPFPTRGHRFPLADSVSGNALRRRVPVVVEGLDAAAGRFAEERYLAGAGYGSVACFPLIVDDTVLGTLEIAHAPDEGLMEHCFHHAERVARLIAIALHNSLMVDEVRRLNRLLERENAYLKEEVELQWGEFVAESRAMVPVVEQVRRVAPADTTVLILGETGTGKEGLARVLHDASPRAAGPFVVVNLGAIPEGLIESELFGHEKGAFTGAIGRKQGRFEQADHGTLFLDEVGDAPLSVQVRLLRALQERRIRRVGGSEEIAIDVRVVAATHRPLEEMVAAAAFREDLYYRLNTFPIVVPPLRERLDALAPLVRHLLARHSQRMNRKPPEVTDDALATLASYRWPGNVRELENFLERALILSPPGELVLPELAAERVEDVPAAELPSFDAGVRDLLKRALDAAAGKIYGDDGAAALLGLKPTTLQGKLRRHGLTGYPSRRGKGVAPRA